jgi:hypothetical protein
LNVFALPDNHRIIFSNRSKTSFIYDGSEVQFGKLNWLANILPEGGWFTKINKKVKGDDTILIIEASWELTNAQKRFVSKYIN